MGNSKPDRPSNGLNKLFSTPSLMNGEDGETYAALYAEVEALIEPRNVLDRMRVSDIATRFWEQRRYRRASGAVVNARRRAALVTILNGDIGLGHSDAHTAADRFFGLKRKRDPGHRRAAKLPRDRAGVVGLLEKHGFSEADIDNIALQMSLDTLADLENLALKHETRREAIFAELMRGRERRKKDAHSTEPAEQADVTDSVVSPANRGNGSPHP
jgi:hypothetical protein